MCRPTPCVLLAATIILTQRDVAHKDPLLRRAIRNPYVCLYETEGRKTTVWKTIISKSRLYDFSMENELCFAFVWSAADIVSHKNTFNIFDVHRAVHLHIISIVKPKRCTNVSKFILFLEWHSTCFGRSFRPSSGVQGRRTGFRTTTELHNRRAHPHNNFTFL